METNQTLKRKLLAPAMAIILAIALTTGCEDLRPKDNWPGLIDASATDVGENYAEIEVSTVLESNAVRKVGIEYGTSSSLGYATEMSGAHISLTALQSGTRYYYRPYVKDYMGNLYNGLQIKSFNTKEKPVPFTFGDGVTAASAFGGGTGTSSSPYLISTAGQLKKLVDDVSKGTLYTGSYFKLTQNVSVTASEWIPIGTDLTTSFRGTFDGNGHTVSGTLTSERYKHFGFFGEIYEATVTNLTIEATVKSTYAIYVGGVVGYAFRSCVIRNCTVSGTVTGPAHVGGICGYFSSGITMHTCLNTASVIGTQRVGGLIGASSSGDTIYSCCTNRGTVNGQAASSNNVTGNGISLTTCPDGHNKR